MGELNAVIGLCQREQLRLHETIVKYMALSEGEYEERPSRPQVEFSRLQPTPVGVSKCLAAELVRNNKYRHMLVEEGDSGFAGVTSSQQ